MQRLRPGARHPPRLRFTVGFALTTLGRIADHPIRLDEPATLVQARLVTGEIRSLLDGDAPFDESEAGVAIFAAGSPSAHASLASGGYHDSTAALPVPSADVDSDEVTQTTIDFYVSDRLVVFVSGSSPLSRSQFDALVSRVVADIQADLQPFGSWEGDPGIDDLSDLAEDVRWVVIDLLRRRVRAVEASVRSALADDQVTSEDYAALREYPKRLWRVEHLVSTMPFPDWTPHRPPQILTSVTLPGRSFGERFNAVADEARETSARLSGLISSQQVVLQQRQAAETERFQRLLTLVGTTVLVPGLVAAIFGANVSVPGEDTGRGFWAMALFMIAAGAGSYALLRSLEAGTWVRVMRRLSLARLQTLPEGARLLTLALLAVAAAVAGVIVLSYG